MGNTAMGLGMMGVIAAVIGLIFFKGARAKIVPGDGGGDPGSGGGSHGWDGGHGHGDGGADGGGGGD